MLKMFRADALRFRLLPHAGRRLSASDLTRDLPKLFGIYGALIGLNILAWIWAFSAFFGRPALLGTALLAYVFGLRHAVDADHIAAIDNVVRKLMQDNKRPLSVGLFFSLGHSTVVLLATVVIAASAATLQGRFALLRETGGMIGTSVSALFLSFIAGINIVILRQIWSSFQIVRRGGHIEVAHLDTLFGDHGALTRVLRPFFRMMSESWHMYPLGILFGLGFDTATEIGLLGLSAAQASQGLNPISLLIFPTLFAAGMTLVDTTDGVFMVEAYGWAFVNPERKLWYNLTMTAASILVATMIGGVEVLGLLASKLNLSGTFWRTVQALNDDLVSFGFLVIGLFALSWIVSALVFNFKNAGGWALDNR